MWFFVHKWRCMIFQKMFFLFFWKKIYVDFLSTNDAPQHSQKSIFGFHVDFLSTNDAPSYTRFVGFFVHNLQIGVKWNRRS